MGSELQCKVRAGGKTLQGKALLETSEVIFRGDSSFKIPFASIQTVNVKGGELHLTWSGGSAIFELGDRAAKWADKILHPKSTAEKLGIKPGMTASVQAIRDAAFLTDLREKAEKVSTSRLLKDSDLIFFGAAEESDLADVAEVIPSLANAGALWIVYPKGKQEITEGQVLAAGRAAGLLDVKVVKFSETHTALKFVRPRNKR
jgi:Protein of unknown function (DUF3052)